MITRPLLAATVKYDQLDSIQYPALVSPKIDGIRCLLHPDLGPVSRSFKPIPNNYIYNKLTQYSYLDGELVVQGDFNTVQSAVMRQTGTPEFEYLVFDCFYDQEAPFENRLQKAKVLAQAIPEARLVPHYPVSSKENLMDRFSAFMDAGYEGLMVRSLYAPYKSGRSTLRQGYLLKLKPVDTGEGQVTGTEALERNLNPKLPDELGLSRRSSHQENKVAVDRLGALVLDTEWGELRVGTGFTEDQRIKYWNTRESLIGRVVQFQYQSVGMKDVPRFPSFKGFRQD